jgi:hypothetical protein
MEPPKEAEIKDIMVTTGATREEATRAIRKRQLIRQAGNISTVSDCRNFCLELLKQMG